RKFGMLAHISSLPGKYGVGDMGSAACDFASFLADAGFSAWQILPLGPTSPAAGHSPYSSPSAFAGNPVFVSPDILADWGLLEKGRLSALEAHGGGKHSSKADFEGAFRLKKKIIGEAYETFRKDEAYKTRFKALSDEFWDFCAAEAYWLEDYALFCVLKETTGDVSWSEWPEEYRSRDWSVLDRFKAKPEIAKKLDALRFEQFIFYRQLQGLYKTCGELGIELIGDMPIYVGYDSADVWGHQELFELDFLGRPVCVAGVPPDYYSKTGQRWGNPIYRWDTMREDGFLWWLGRFRHALRYLGRVRIDHFRGFVGYWEIPAEDKTAENGRWKNGPGQDFLSALKHCCAREDGTMPFIAEDLGVMTDDVMAAMERFALPGMKVLQFAFGQGMPSNPYIPHHHRRDCVVYAGTHDNNTTAGWWREDASPLERENFRKYLAAGEIDASEARDAMIRMAAASPADLAIISAQDALGLGSESRMNTPSTPSGNWTWRMDSLDSLKAKTDEFRELAILFDRCDAPERQDELSSSS
ncbi:MAG: 4-alpha-glucanotransferase, partial [Synergistaceae bacterium]|nr:4-alpha-glucanotransferase [Synergistaceae bacterium]